MFYSRKSDGRTYEFCPVPTLTHANEHSVISHTEVGSTLAVISTYTLNGYLLPTNPALSGVSPDASCIELLDRKKDQLNYALNEQRGNWLVVDGSGYTIINEYPIVRNVSFDDSQMVSHLKYAITLEFETDYGANKVKAFNETWNVQQNDDDTYAITHSLNAVGIPDFPAATGALKNARNFIISRAGTADSSKFSFSTSPHVPALIDIATFGAYNHSRSEAVDEANGSYDLTENWVMASGAYQDDRTITRDYTLNELNQVIETVSVNGTVVGRGDTTFARYDNAVDGFTNFVTPQINFGMLTGFTSKNRVDNRIAGTVSYSVSIIPSGSGVSDVEDRQVSRSFQMNEDGTVSQTVSTSARIRLGSSLSINDAENFCFENNYPINSTFPPFNASLSGNVESISKQIDELTKSYSLSRTFREQGTSAYREEWEVNRELNAETSTVQITVNGTVFGLGFEPTTNGEVRFIAASGAYTNNILPLIRQRAYEIAPTGTCLSANPVRETLGWARKTGRVSYSQSFDNRSLTSNPSIKNELIEASYVLPTDVTVDFVIPGKDDGPIIQDIQTITGPSKTLSISYTMVANTSGACGVTSASSRAALEAIGLAESNILVNNTVNDNDRGEKPVGSRVFKTQDEYRLSSTNVFTRTVSWKWAD